MIWNNKSSQNKALWLIIAMILTGFIGVAFGISDISEYAPDENQIKDSTEPKSQAYGYYRFGIHVDGPTYVQRRVNDYSSSTSIQFQAINYAGEFLYNQFSYYRTIINNVVSSIQYFSDSYYGYLYFSIYDYIATAQVVPITLQIFHSPTEKWFNHTFILNITAGIYISDSIPNHVVNQYSGDWFYWDVMPTTYDAYSSYVYELYIDGNYYSANTMGYYADFSTDYTYFGHNEIGIHTVEFRARDLFDGSVAINRFNVTVAPPNMPNVNYANLDCSSEFVVGMNQIRKITFACFDSDYDLDRALIFAGEPRRVVGIIPDIINNQQYEFIINDAMMEKLLGSSTSNSFTFYIQALDRSGKISSMYNWQFYIYARRSGSTNLEGLNPQHLSIGPTLNPVSFNFTEINQYNSEPILSIEYKITYAMKSQVLQDVTVAASTCRRWRDVYCYSTGLGNCEVGYSQEYENYVYYDAGMIFIINPENTSAILWPIKIKLVYPAWIEPVSDEFTQEPSLALLHFEANCYNNYWNRVDSSAISSVGIRTVQFTIEQPGTYFYGKYRADYENKPSDQSSRIPGFPVELTILCMVVATIGLIGIIAKKRQI